MRNEIAVSVDIETDGPTIGVNSLLSIGAVAYRDKEEVGQFSVNILRHGEQDPDTMEFWAKWPEAWEALSTGLHHPQGAMLEFTYWLQELSTAPNFRFVAWPCWFDYGWVRQYFLKYTGADPFNRKYFELGQAWHILGMKPPKIHNPAPHVALADALEQGRQYIQLLEWLDANGGRPWEKKAA